MKKTGAGTFIFLLFVIMVCGNAANAQSFLKRIVSDVKSTVQNRADTKTNNTTNKALDKVDSAAQIKSNPNKANQDDQNRVLGGFAKAASDNPNDTSINDMMTKSLGNIIGGNGLSAQDSAQAIQGFKSVGGGSTSGIYFEITNTVTAKGKTPVSNVTKDWFTSDGRGRGEMDMAGLMAAMMGRQVNSRPMVTISRANMPTYSVMINDQDRTYSLNIIDTAFLAKHAGKYKATLIGNEAVEGYSCKHVKVSSNKQTFDIWTSTDVPGYAIYQKLSAAFTAATAGGMMGALKQASAVGFIVKMTISAKNVSEEMLLTKAQQQSGIPNNYFIIPAGYTFNKNNGMISSLMQAGSGGGK